MNYGFIIDNRNCIGCHACSTACKSENRVPLGSYRTWVKYVEKGTFPNARRFFQVTRCNHCANPPCVRICPVTAMYQRTDGIVEFDPEVCIGCKACMQACPYDAIYIDPDRGTAAKCHYCSHRTDIGLEPACVVVCPTQAIISGDMDDPDSEISRLLGRHDVSVRKPEQGTVPKLFYIDADESTLTPSAPDAHRTFMFADIVSEQRVGRAPAHTSGRTTGAINTAHSGVPIRTPQPQGGASDGPITFNEGPMAQHMVQNAYNAQHKVPWHWPVPAYLVTKGIGSGVFMLVALLFALGIVEFNRPLALVSASVSLLFTGITTALLVLDLERPERFYTILTRPQWASWLTRGAFILIGFSAIAGLWFLLEGSAAIGVLPDTLATTARPFFLLTGVTLAGAAAVYTGFLFGQAEGRDLWQSTLLPAHLIVQALMVGAGTLFIVGLLFPLPTDVVSMLIWVFGASLIVDLLVTLLGEFGMPHASESAAQAAHDIRAGTYRMHFWLGSMAVGHLLPLGIVVALAVTGTLSVGAMAIAGAASIVGLYLFEYAFVMAPQHIPNS